MYSGHVLVLMYKWDIDEALRLIEAEGVTEMTGVPYVVRTFLDAAVTTGRDLSTLTGLGFGGSLSPEQLIKDVYTVFGGRVSPRTGYGLTETTSGVVAIGGADYVARPDSIGRPLPTVEIRIVGEDGVEVPVGEPGEITVRGPQVVSGYWRAPEATAASFRAGWFHTGDVGRVADDGFIHIVGRIKDVVIRGGENINCGEVESCLLDYAGVVEAAAFGVPHPSLGEELGAVVVVAGDQAGDPERIRAHVAERLAAFKVPAYVYVSHRPLPRTATGKVVKQGLAEFAAGG
jgi:acyl-CoA synthetase (AMP-forming)/AMP-acid ligase II